MFLSATKIRYFSLFVCLAMVAMTVPAHAEGTQPTEQQFDAAFARMMDDPSNLAATMDYANIAVQRENYEAAIPALERLLFFNPNLPDVRLQLGILYYKLHSYDVAREYLNSAKAEGAPQDVAEKATAYLAKLGG